MKSHILTIIFIGISLELCNSQQSDVRTLPGPRIVGGRPADYAHTKHQVSIRLKSYDKRFGSAHICGGSLIGPRKVLTAAHCFYSDETNRYRKASEFIVVMGTLDRFKRNKGTVVSEVKSIAYMKTFNINTMQDDVGVMLLKKDLPLNKTHLTVAPIALAKSPLPAGTLCQVTGWGRTGTNEALSPILLTANVSIISRSICANSYSNLLSGMICAGNWSGGTDSCQGDSGGPLVHNNVLVGIVSWGIECALRKYPGVYSDVHLYRSWIEAQNTGSSLVWSSLSLVVALISVYFVR